MSNLMSAKHFTMIAAQLKSARDTLDPDVVGPSNYIMGIQLLNKVARDLATKFEQENNQFRRVQFLAACGLEGYVWPPTEG